MLICRIYMKHVCDTYLSQCLHNTYTELYVDTFVTDPDPKYVQKLTSTLLTDLSTIPPPLALKKLFRDILRNESGQELIAELFFNHLIIPAITSPPDTSTIQTKPFDKNTAHVVSKMISGLVNSVVESEDEGGTKPFATQQNKSLVQTILSNLTSITKRREMTGVVEESKDVPDAAVVGDAISVIRDGMVNNLDKLWEAAVANEKVLASLQHFMAVCLSEVQVQRW